MYERNRFAHKTDQLKGNPNINILSVFQIKRSQLEPEIVPLTEETELFYNRGV